MRTVGEILKAIEGATNLKLSCEKGREEALELYNRINEIVWNREKFPGVEREMCFSVEGQCFTLPRQVETLENAKFSNRKLPIHLPSWKYLESGVLDSCVDCGPALEYLGDHFTLQRTPSCPVMLFAVSDRPEDEDAEILIRWSDDFGREVGPSHRGFTLPIQLGDMNTRPAGTPELIDQEPCQITKSRTCGYVMIYGYDPVSGQAEWLGMMAPDETSACYSRYRVNSPECVCGCVSALVKLRQIDHHCEEDASPIDSREFYRMMALSLKELDDKNFQTAAGYEGKAMKLLTNKNKALRPRGSGSSVSVRRNPMGVRFRRGGIR